MKHRVKFLLLVVVLLLPLVFSQVACVSADVESRIQATEEAVERYRSVESAEGP